MKTFLRYATHYWILWIIVAILVLGTGFYFAGYRLDTAGFSRVGTLSIPGLPAGSALYIDESRRVETLGGAGTAALSPGTHSVIVDAPGYQPWNERFTVLSGETVVLRPLLVKDKVAARRLEGEEASRALALIRASVVPTKTAPLFMEGGCASVYALGSRVLAEAPAGAACEIPAYLACAPISPENPDGTCASTIIRSDTAAVKGIVAYPGREDAIVVVGDNSVYGLELDPREPQSYVLLFQGPTIGVAPWSPTSIVASNGDIVFELAP